MKLKYFFKNNPTVIYEVTIVYNLIPCMREGRRKETEAFFLSNLKGFDKISTKFLEKTPFYTMQSLIKTLSTRDGIQLIIEDT